MDRYASDYNQKPLHMSAHGNAWSEDYAFTGTIAETDKVYMGIIPAGVRVQDVRLVHHAAGTGATATLGFEPVDDSPQADADYWLNAASVAAAGAQQSNAAPVTFNRPVKLVLTAGGADYAAGTVRVVVFGAAVGAP
jgi:hypothetical protein